MAKKLRLLRKGRSPSEVADTVVKHYVSVARAKLGDWQKNYVNGVSFYTISADKQREAQSSLTTWYETLLAIRPRIAEAYAVAKAEYLAKKAGVTLPPVKATV